MSESRPCPRCGGKVKTESFDLVCQNKLCKIRWPNTDAYDRECLARDLAGTRAIQITEDWLPQNSKDKSGLAQELESLVYLVRLETLREVETGLTDAIEGRNTAAYRDRGELKASIERDVLESMKHWVRSLQVFAEDRT